MYAGWYGVWFEPTLRQYIWEEIENNLNLKVSGEVPLQFDVLNKKVRIQPDLIGFSGKEYYGFEVKLKPCPTAGDFEGGRRKARQGKAKRRRDAVASQLAKMAGSRYFDCCYLCCLENDLPYLSGSRHFIQSLASIETSREIATHYPEYDKVGILAFSGDGRLRGEPVKARKIRRSRKPKLPRDNEGFVRHHTFSKLDKRFCDYKICEGILPNPEKGSPLRIDIMSFKGSDNPTEILRKQDMGDELIGIEAKGRNFNVRATLTELGKYKKSGGLTRLYFAFHETSLDRALNLERRISGIGLISVAGDGNIEIVKEAEKIEMKYDCIRFNAGLDTAFGSPVSELVTRIITVNVGWSRYVDQYDSLFDQTV